MYKAVAVVLGLVIIPSYCWFGFNGMALGMPRCFQAWIIFGGVIPAVAALAGIFVWLGGSEDIRKKMDDFINFWILILASGVGLLVVLAIGRAVKILYTG